MLRTRYPGVHILQLAAKSVSGSNDRARGVFHRNFRQTGRQGYSGKHRKRSVADRNTCGSRRRNGPGHHPGAERMLTDFKGADHVYIACGYTDLRRGIDGLASLVQQQFQLDPFCFCSVGGGETGSRGCTGRETDLFCCYKRANLKVAQNCPHMENMLTEIKRICPQYKNKAPGFLCIL